MANAYTQAPAFKDAFFDATRTLFASTDPEVQIVFGHPGTSMVDDIIAFGRVRSAQDPATFGTNRSREETLTLEVMFSCFRGGGIEMEEVCSDRAYELLGKVEHMVRMTDTTLGGVVRHCALVSHESEGETNAQVLAQGRLIEVLATFEAKARISGSI